MPVAFGVILMKAALTHENGAKPLHKLHDEFVDKPHVSPTFTTLKILHAFETQLQMPTTNPCAAGDSTPLCASPHLEFWQGSRIPRCWPEPSLIGFLGLMLVLA